MARAGDDPLDAAHGLILLPTRRAARALAEAFLRAGGGRPMLLPRITAFGALDEAPLALVGGLALPPEVEPARRLATLARLILALDGAVGAPRTADRAWPLAAELAALMDEAELAEVDLAARLPNAADPAHADHWQQTLAFLEIVTRSWPDWLAEQGLANPAARLVALLDQQARAWTEQPPDMPVLVAGTTGAIPAVARLLRVVARLDQGAVLLPAVDLAMSDAAWDAIGETHPQAGIRALLAGLGASRGDARPWPVPRAAAGEAGRAVLLSTALLPAPALPAWRDAAISLVATEGLYRLSPADQQEEASAIALILRGALEAPGARAALVTPDRDLAGRVSAELLRYGVVVDDSAGEKLAETPPAVFLRLIAHAVIERLAPVPLLSLLKHPLAAAGMAPAACRALARRLESRALRGPRPPPGLAGLRRAIDSSGEPEVKAFLDAIERALAPALRIASSASHAAPGEAVAALIETAEQLAATASEPGAVRLWATEDGEALAAHLAGILAVLPELPDQPIARLPALLDAMLEGAVVRTRRALRGRSGAEHPRVFIWGLLEARLQSAEVMVLAGLAEGVWPPAVEPGPWLSRPMRRAIGLPSPDARVGEAAHDFVAAACAAPTVILSCPRRRDGAPAVPARWLTRIETLLSSRGKQLARHSAADWTRRIDQAAGPPCPAAPPRPCPDVRLRPRRLSVTEIETWLRDPYAIHARHILRLLPLDALDESGDAARYGKLAHAGLHHFLRVHGTSWPPDAERLLEEALIGALRGAYLRDALIAWWAPRLSRIARWVAETEITRRAESAPVALGTELAGECVFDRPGGAFALRARADRIERRPDGRLVIIDYKTGMPPTLEDVKAGYAPQLPLEAAMAEAGAFGPALAGEAAALAYWHITGGFQPGSVVDLFKGDAAAVAAASAQAREKLLALIDDFDDPARCYLAQPHPGQRPRFPQYGQLARLAEWDAVEEGG